MLQLSRGIWRFHSHRNHNEEARKTVTAKYLQRVRQVLKSQLNVKNKILTINNHALLVIRYPAGMVSGPIQDMETRNWVIPASTPVRKRGSELSETQSIHKYPEIAAHEQAASPRTLEAGLYHARVQAVQPSST